MCSTGKCIVGYRERDDITVRSLNAKRHIVIIAEKCIIQFLGDMVFIAFHGPFFDFRVGQKRIDPGADVRIDLFGGICIVLDGNNRTGIACGA